MSLTVDVLDPEVVHTVHDYGDRALLLEFDSTEAVLAWAEAIRAANLPGVIDIVPAARTVLVKLDGPRYQQPTRQRLAKLHVPRSAASALTPPETVDVELAVIYDGPDLAEVAELTGLTPEQVVAAHTGTPWRVGFSGFAPGFAYLVGGDPRLQVPRRAEPRTQVPAGSVGLAGEFSGVYPRQSPGGWQLIGRTAPGQPPMWDVNRDQPALLLPGMWVRFRAVTA
ncbi:allophanate hydrolase subunit 1 [Mycolicibacterium hassiacum DSM 44199]|uniref:Allophanate hydrolase subunit 1 n=1 Tax=Mycolicibacterium hassiacum (strain DSM 44199 / CIP 105218 / JCM 12690 / 3849) TaxID=1122247 RepID=K5BH95_MYCHD|nr:allophanate hydrolase subunit 1 [Mycolicibacterium hassiacum]EKF25487.1 allophanate hydrolase subunit 1 [Mycolicibacterium hassiacum DSM 44199]MDA4086657.1 allophanate hydrolase [Mycolicibacterium hassiacum DSM 44199]VCT92859.1 Kinase A inhibitor [Mycolicibacterium hassiacum DSM 44199]